MAIIRWEPLRPEDFSGIKIPKLASGLVADIYEKGVNVVAEVSVPGIDPDEITVEVNDDYLSISGERENEILEEDKSYYYQELQRGSFSRTFRLPVDVDPKRSTAEFNEGILVITMPKITKRATTKLKVNNKAKKTK